MMMMTTVTRRSHRPERSTYDGHTVKRAGPTEAVTDCERYFSLPTEPHIVVGLSGRHLILNCVKLPRLRIQHSFKCLAKTIARQ